MVVRREQIVAREGRLAFLANDVDSAGDSVFGAGSRKFRARNGERKREEGAFHVGVVNVGTPCYSHCGLRNGEALAWPGLGWFTANGFVRSEITWTCSFRKLPFDGEWEGSSGINWLICDSGSWVHHFPRGEGGGTRNGYLFLLLRRQSDNVIN